MTLPPDPDLERAGGATPAFAPVVLVAVAAGGVIGALARDGLTRAVAAQANGFPWATIAINVSGSLLLGLLVGVLAGRPDAPAWLRPLLGTGVLGGYTTFSTFAVETDRLVSQGRPGVAAAYAAGTLVLGAAASLTGLGAARAAPPGAR